jgi:hypothetical protein
MGQSDPLQTQDESSTARTTSVVAAIASTYHSAKTAVDRGYREGATFLTSVLAALGIGATADHDTATRSLLLAMGLPLVDGVFPALVLGGALETIPGLFVVGGTIFGGPWMLTIIFDQMTGDSLQTRVRRILKVTAVVIPAAGLEAVAAPTIASLLDIGVFHVFSALIILTVGASIANDVLAGVLVAPKYLLGTGLVASVSARVLSPAPITPAVVVDPVVVAQAMGAATIATTIGLAGAVLGPRIDDRLDNNAFEVGAGIALALVPLSIAGLLPSLSSLAVFALAVAFAVKNPTED